MIIKAKKEAEKLKNKSLSDIAEENNIKLLFGDLSNMYDYGNNINTNGKGNIYGIIKSNSEDKGSICNYIIAIDNVNNNDMKYLKFLLAYQLGHFFMNKKVLDNKDFFISYINLKESYIGEDNIKQELIKELEINAYEFALNLLMPEKIFEESSKKYSIKVLSDIFEVPEKEILFRYNEIYLNLNLNK